MPNEQFPDFPRPESVTSPVLQAGREVYSASVTRLKKAFAFIGAQAPEFIDSTVGAAYGTYTGTDSMMAKDVATYLRNQALMGTEAFLGNKQ